ncbi:zinc transporter ZIP2-like [Culex pipiens pallens]|uniref:zinc transporter ZIP2-like n=1 Tax=Culex pipiens pallens TaxID=42434 RepID=UPI0022AA00D3|nr:zinc transporter ZIP2-like [Culex pipiens pallens]
MDLTDRLGSSGSKLLALVVLGVGSLASGAAPLYLDQRQARARTARNSTLLITVLLCFGAGVLLATALVHMLADVRLYLPRYAEVVFCGGFFLIYVIEELVQLWRTGVNQPKVLTNSVAAADCCNSGDSISLENKLSTSKTSTQSETQPTPLQPQSGTFSLLLALCIHSLLEGLAIGVQSSAPKVLLLLGAISAHKFVVAFCLGVEICSQNHPQTSRTSNLVQIVIFSLGSVLGIAIGMALDRLDDTFNRLVIPGLQGVAGGTLLYVTLSEVLPRERAKAKTTEGRATGLWQLCAVVAGFAVMSALSLLISEG